MNNLFGSCHVEPDLLILHLKEFQRDISNSSVSEMSRLFLRQMND